MMMILLIMMIKEPEVEFFNPKLRHELEKKDADIRTLLGSFWCSVGWVALLFISIRDL